MWVIFIFHICSFGVWLIWFNTLFEFNKRTCSSLSCGWIWSLSLLIVKSVYYNMDGFWSNRKWNNILMGITGVVFTRHTITCLERHNLRRGEGRMKWGKSLQQSKISDKKTYQTILIISTYYYNRSLYTTCRVKFLS